MTQTQTHTQTKTSRTVKTPVAQLAPFAKGSNTRVRWIPQVSPELRANQEKLMRDLRLLERARVEGAENRPEPEAREIDVAQREVLQAVDEKINMLRQFGEARLAEAAHLVNERTPTLIEHQELDYRCPLSQAEQWYAALKKLGIPTKLLIYPGESHGMSRSGKPRHRIERLGHNVGWFDEWLGATSDE